MDMQDWKSSKGYINLSPKERDRIDKLMIAGRTDEAWGEIHKSELRIKRNDMLGKVASAAGQGVNMLTSDADYDVGSRIDPLDSSEKFRSAGATALDAAAQGASAGALFGPAGMAIGAGVGAAVGGVKGMIANKRAEKDILKNRVNRNDTLAMKREAERESEMNTGAVQYVSDGGFIRGKGGPTDDMNPGKLDPGDFVIPAGTTPMAKELVSQLAKTIKEDKPKRKMNDGSRPVRLSDGELVIPKEKVPFAEQLLGNYGTSLEDIRDKTLQERGDKPETMFPHKAGRPMVDSHFNTQNRSFVPMKEGGEVPSWLEPSSMLFQTASGLIQQRQAENRIKQGLKDRRKREKDLEGEAFVSKGKADQIVNRSFRDTERTVRGLKQEGAKNIAMNSLNPQDYNQNISKLISDLGEVVSKSNIEKANALTQNELQLLSRKEGAAGRMGQIDSSEAGLNIAKATQAASKAQAGMQGAYDMIQARKDEQARKKRSVELIEQAKAMGSEYTLAMAIQAKDVEGIQRIYENMGLKISEEEAKGIAESEAKTGVPTEGEQS